MADEAAYAASVRASTVTLAPARDTLFLRTLSPGHAGATGAFTDTESASHLESWLARTEDVAFGGSLKFRGKPPSPFPAVGQASVRRSVGFGGRYPTDRSAAIVREADWRNEARLATATACRQFLQFGRQRKISSR